MTYYITCMQVRLPQPHPVTLSPCHPCLSYCLLPAVYSMVVRSTMQHHNSSYTHKTCFSSNDTHSCWLLVDLMLFLSTSPLVIFAVITVPSYEICQYLSPIWRNWHRIRWCFMALVASQAKHFIKNCPKKSFNVAKNSCRPVVFSWCDLRQRICYMICMTRPVYVAHTIGYMLLCMGCVAHGEFFNYLLHLF